MSNTPKVARIQALLICWPLYSPRLLNAGRNNPKVTRIVEFIGLLFLALTSSYRVRFSQLFSLICQVDSSCTKCPQFESYQNCRGYRIVCLYAALHLPIAERNNTKVARIQALLYCFCSTMVSFYLSKINVWKNFENFTYAFTGCAIVMSLISSGPWGRSYRLVNNQSKFLSCFLILFYLFNSLSFSYTLLINFSKTPCLLLQLHCRNHHSRGATARVTLLYT